MNHINPPRNFLFLINPVAGGVDSLQLKSTIQKKLKDNYFFNYNFEETNAKDNFSIIRSKIIECKFTDIIIIGGDGSVNKITGQLRDLPIQFGIIPTGSGNGLARTARISMNIDQAFNIILKGKTTYIDAFLINNRYACMLTGIGFDGAVAHNFALKKERGFLSYLKSTLEQQRTLKSYKIEIEVNGLIFKTEAYLICIANSNQFGNNIKIAPIANLSDGLLDMVIVPVFNQVELPFQILKHLFIKKIAINHQFSNQRIEYLQIKKIKILNLELAPMHIDGEPVESMEKIEIQIIENAFKLIVP